MSLTRDIVFIILIIIVVPEPVVVNYGIEVVIVPDLYSELVSIGAFGQIAFNCRQHECVLACAVDGAQVFVPGILSKLNVSG